MVVPEFLGESAGMVALRGKIERLLKNPAQGRRYQPVLIEGETGTGKSVLAQALHRAGVRQNGPFVPVNCTVFTESLAEMQMFGNERGVYTGAHDARPGFFQLADKGTLFLDEIGLMSMTLQPMLLTAIDEGTVRRIGAGRSQSVDVWVIAASNEDLGAARREKRLREDLYHRLAGLTLSLPPLRERGNDIVLLAQHFLERSCREHGFTPKSLSEDACGALLGYGWSGNVRELASVIERAVMFSDADVITADALELPAAPPTMPAFEARPSKQKLGEIDARQMIAVYREEQSNLSRAADRLKMPRNTLRYRLKQLGVLDEARAHPQPPTPHETSRQLRRLALLRVEVSATPSDRPSPIEEWLDIVSEKVEIFGGREMERRATGLTAAFGLEPVEDAPSRAAHVATALLQAAKRARVDGETIHLKLAVDVRWGMVEVGADGAGLSEADRGEAWQRLEALGQGAEPDTAVTSEAAVTFLVRRFELAPLVHRAGVPRPIYQIVGHVRPGLGFGKRVATFVGRDDDLARIRAQFAAVVKGQRRAVGIVGEAGIGKSRLVREFRRSLSRDDVIWLEGACFSYAHTIPYVPVLAILRASCGIGEADTHVVVTDRLRRRLAQLDLNVEESLPCLLQLFGLREGTEGLVHLTPEEIRRRTLNVFHQMIAAASERRPMVIAVEDVHWADRASEEILYSLLTGDARVLFLSTYRPGFQPPPWMGKSFATQIALSSLSAEDSRTMLQSVLEDDIPESLARMILDRADGNPFFLEEIYRTVEGLGRPETLPEVPGSIADVLLARIERLPQGPKSVLQAAAVLGREFAWRLLEGVWRGEGSLEAHMAVLTELEFLYQRADARGRTYAFKHSLTQQVADETMPDEQRRQLHAAAGRALETLFADRLEEVYDRLAHHYSQTEEAHKAVYYLAHLAEKAARGDAREEAVLAWRDALQHVERLPPDVRDRRRLEILLSLSGSLLPLGRIGEVEALLGPERERLERLKDPALAGRYYFMLARVYMLGKHALVVDHAQLAIRAAERCEDAATMGGAYGVLAVACALSGQAERGIEYAQRAVDLLETTTSQWSLSYAYWALGLCATQLGRFREALAAQRRAQEVAQAIGDAVLDVSATWAIGIVRAAVGEWDDAIADCQHAVAAARDVLYRALATGFLGFAYTEKGPAEAERAVAELETSIPLVREFRMKAYEGWFTAFLAEAYRLAGHLEMAEARAEEALRTATEARFQVAAGWAQLNLGRIAYDRGDLEAAASRLDLSLAIFSETRSSYEWARVRVELARVSHARGADEAARQHLEAARARFVKLDVPIHVERVEHLAAEWGITLST